MADEDGEVEENIDGLSHPEVMSLFSKKLAEIMSDPLLIGLPNEPTLDEVNSQIALEHGRAIVVNVRQQDEMNTVLRKELSILLVRVELMFSDGSKKNRNRRGIAVGAQLDVHVTSSNSQIQNQRATKGFILIRRKRNSIYSCLQLSSSRASFVWKPVHFEFRSYGGA